MKTAISAKQRGLGFGGFVMGAFLLVMLSILGLKLIPAYLNNASITSMFVSMANDPDMQKSSTQDVRNSFSKRASIDNITVIKPDDIDISIDDGQLVLTANYTVLIPLFANASLLLEFKPSSVK